MGFVLPTSKVILIVGHIDILTKFVALLKLYEDINLLLVVQLLIKLLLLEYSSISYSSQTKFQEIETEFMLV